jgi:hypothetical protein
VHILKNICEGAVNGKFNYLQGNESSIFLGGSLHIKSPKSVYDILSNDSILRI